MGKRASDEIVHMMVAFSDAVLQPLVGAEERTDNDPGILGPWHDPVFSAAARILVGKRTLGGLADVCGRWRSRASRIAARIADLGEGMMPAGPALFEDIDLGEGRYLTCLNTVRSLVDEGAPGSDAWGEAGLDHCVGGFADKVLSGRTAILSHRRRRPDGGFERLSTVEVDFGPTSHGRSPVILQHYGRRNAMPDPASTASVAAAVRAVAVKAVLALARHGTARVDIPDTSTLIACSGAWEEIRDMWAFALPGPLRGLDGEGMLRAGGYRLRAPPTKSTRIGVGVSAGR